MEPDRETLNAFVDGELPPKDMEQIAALLDTRPDLNRYVQEQEQLRADLKDAYALSSPVPEQLAETVRFAPVSWRWRMRSFLARGLSAGAVAAAAAALTAGLVIGIAVHPAADFGTDAAGRLVAEGGLGKALSSRLASEGYPGSGPRIGISYRTKAGRDCRTFTNGDAAGLACREHGLWVIGTLVAHPKETTTTSYRMAGSEMPDAVRRAVAASIDGAPFDAAAEKRARDEGWSGR